MSASHKTNFVKSIAETLDRCRQASGTALILEERGVAAVSTYILVPGAWHGGWWYEPVVTELTARGHRAVAVTLAGLCPDDDLTRTVVTLDTHVAQVVDQLRRLSADGSV